MSLGGACGSEKLGDNRRGQMKRRFADMMYAAIFP